jgi:biofilm PGA synthesis N-glycosyltransferase PgaC
MVTPVREDAGQLDDLAATVRAQERRPALWVIVDDGSSDDTAARLRRLRARDPWIHAMTLPRTPQGEPRRRDLVVTMGFRRASELAEAEGIDHRYVVNLDPDLRCPPQLVAELVERSERDRSVGIASCTIQEVADDGRAERRRDVIDGLPRADLRVWRRACVEEVGMQPAPRWAETTGIRARNRGWLTPVFEDLVVEAARPGVLRHAWQGFRSEGAESWEVGLHPLVLAHQAMAASVQDRDLRGVAILAGYVEAAISGQRRSRDPEVREYFGEDLLKQQARTLLSRMPVVGRRFRRKAPR